MNRIKSIFLLAVLLFSLSAFSADHQSTTTVIDPAGNVTTQVFFGPYPFSVTYFKGSSTQVSKNEMCYNGASYPCSPSTVSQPVSSKDIYLTITGVGSPARSSTAYNTYGQPTDIKGYDYGPVLKTEQVLTYATITNIVNRPNNIVRKDGGGTTVSRTTFTYDGAGNLLTRNGLVAGSTFLSETFTYTGKGVVATSTGYNNAQTVYTNGSCNGLAPTSVAFPLTGSEVFTWDCTGAVPTSTTDVNGNNYTVAYNDPFYRPTLGTDALGVTNTYSYTPVSTKIVTSGDAGFTSFTKFNVAGHPIVEQFGNGNGSYSTSSLGYDTMGRKTTSSLPCFSALGSSCPSVQATASYDSGSVPTTVISDSLGGSTTTAYTAGDITMTVCCGESSKSKQLEYDALGRLTSVCEISTDPGSGSCGQRTAATGFVTSYTYDANDNILTITQGSQTRTMTYDSLSRVLTSILPESGTDTYTYDTDGTCGTSNGDLVKRVDAAGNTICYAYDGASRLTGVTYSGPNATDSTFYVYDTATVNSVPMANGKGRLVETYTCTSCPGTKKTDIGYSYNAVGQVTDIYESTVNSGGYYHIALTLHSNQSMASFTMTPAVIPTVSYGLDASGRTSSVQAGGSSLVVSTPRGAANQILSLTYGNNDTDVFGYDANLQMTQYNFSVGGNSVAGRLTYNSNGTLGARVTNDPFKVTNNESCAYSYDSMVRLTTANCGTVNQTFSYDRYGNITKAGSFPFAPTYSATTNRMTAIGAVTPTYDANGNLLTDGTNTYTWDAEGRMLSGPGVSIIYNGMGQMAEQTFGGNHQQIVYFPSGEKLALMNGQALTLARVPLPGGAQAVYTSTGLAYYTHVDALGSVRLTTTAASAVSSDLAYSPFGDPYNNGGVAQSVLSFTGLNQDTIAGLYDTPTRKYNPAQGRWVSSDRNSRATVSDPQSFNLYAYATNRPFDFTDPSGEGDEDLSYSGIPELGTNAPAVDPSTYDPYGFLNSDSASPLVYNAGEPAGGAGGDYGTLASIGQAMNSVDPIGLSAGELDAVPYFVGPYEGVENVLTKLARSLQYYTGGGKNSLKGVEDLTTRVLSRYGSLMGDGPHLALGLTNPGLTREETSVAVQAVGRAKYRSGLNLFAESVGAKTFSNYEVDYTNGLVRGIRGLMDKVYREGGTIHFNLDGLEDIPAAVNGTSNLGTWVDTGENTIFGNPRMIKVPYNNGVTIEELRYLKNNWGRFEHMTFFYKEGVNLTHGMPRMEPYIPW